MPARGRQTAEQRFAAFLLVEMKRLRVELRRERLDELGGEGKRTEIAMLPKNTVKVEGKDADSLFKLLETIEDLDDVQKVWANFDVDVADLSRA